MNCSAFLCGKETVSFSSLLQCIFYVPVHEVKFTWLHGVAVVRPEKSEKSEEKWNIFASVWQKMMSCSFKGQGLVYFDEHMSQVAKTAVKMASKHGGYVLLDPSFTSMLLQEAQVNIKIFPQKKGGLSVSCLAKTGLVNVYMDVRRSFTAEIFNASPLLHDSWRSGVTTAYVTAVLSVRNLAATSGYVLNILERLLDKYERTLSVYVTAVIGFANPI